MDIEELIANNMGLVYKQLHKFDMAYNDEAFSYAMEALMNAAKTFDKSKDIKFSTYASVCIYNGIGVYIRSINKKRQLETVSYEEPLDDTSDIQLVETLGTDVTPETILLQEELHARVRKAVDKVIAETTNATAVSVLEYWRSTDYTAQQAELAKYAGVKQPTISRIISAFKYKVKLELEDYL